MSKTTLGFAMVMQNEEAHIPSSISQFYHIVDDLVVVDGGSSDKSVEWAIRMGARVFHRSFNRDFSAQKNYAISQLDTDWVYLHDPDERLEPTLLEIIPNILDEERQKFFMDLGLLPDNKDPFDCYGIPRKNFIDGLQIETYPDYQYRLFRNYCRYEGKVHEEIVGFKNRTELDFERNSLEKPSRINILHYKSHRKQERQNKLYAEIRNSISKE